MSQHDSSRREFVSSLGLGIAGLSIAGNARADGNFDSDQGDSCTSRATTCSPWDVFKPKPIHEHTLDYGFVVKHPAYWGLPIPGFSLQPEKYTTPDKATVKWLTVSNIQLSTSSGWSGGDFTVYATRTPPLFHAFHHKTDENFFPKKHHKFKFERRPELNVLETDKFGDREPLPGYGRKVLVKLFDAKSNGRTCQWLNPPKKPLPITKFDVRKNGLFDEAVAKKYFETRQGTWVKDKNYEKVGPLGALWIVLLKKEAKNTQLGRLGASYRLWHHLDHMTKAADGYKWNIWQMDKFHRYYVNIELSGRLNKGEKGCPCESISISFELTWT